MVKLAANQKEAEADYHVRLIDRVFAVREEPADGSAQFGDVALAGGEGPPRQGFHPMKRLSATASSGRPHTLA